MHTKSFGPSWLLLLANVGGGYASTWAIYSDADCQKSLNSVAGQNGFPDGVCTNLVDAAPSAYSSFAFITLDEDCAPTIYQPNTDSLTCSGYAFAASISTCYNTSWAYYSIDGCTKSTSTTTIPAITAATSSTSSTSSTASAAPVISGGAIAGAVVGSVCGLGIIAAVSAYFFWFRPKQQRKKKGEQIEAQRDAEGVTGPKDKDGGQGKAIEMHQMPPELLSPTDTVELPTAHIAEAEGDKGGFELHEEPQLVELPGDHEYRSSDSIHSARSR